MKDKLDFYINGQWVQSESSETIEVINPANENVIGHVAAGTKKDVDRAVIAASEAFKIFQYSSKDDRIELLNNIISEYENRYQDFVDTITEEMGAPIWLSSAAQAKTGIKNLNETLDALKADVQQKEDNAERLKEELRAQRALLTEVPDALPQDANGNTVVFSAPSGGTDNSSTVNNQIRLPSDAGAEAYREEQMLLRRRMTVF